MDFSEFRIDFSETENLIKSIKIDFLDTKIDLKFSKRSI